MRSRNEKGTDGWGIFALVLFGIALVLMYFPPQDLERDARINKHIQKVNQEYKDTMNRTK